MAEPILEVKNLTKAFGAVRALSSVSFFVARGETLGIVGESGCGKTTLGRCVVRGIEATSGEVIYRPESGEAYDFLLLNKKELRTRRKELQMIFQDPYSSLDPRMSVFDIIAEPLRANYDLTKSELERRVFEMAEWTGLDARYLRRYPHAFSGGQRQRIGIARALVSLPRLIVCDEAVSALDVSIQAQIVNLLKDLQGRLRLSYIFISHALSVVEYISDRIAVMYLGKIVELAGTEALFARPRHPYTEALLSAAPKPDPDAQTERIILEGEVPNPAHPPLGARSTRAAALRSPSARKPPRRFGKSPPATRARVISRTN
jgi:peptide/nickel transport system ATP-binding protein